MRSKRTAKYLAMVGLVIAAVVASAAAASAASRQVGAPIVGDEFVQQLGSTLAISADGTRIAATSNGADGLGSPNWEVLVFELQNSEWVQLGDSLEFDRSTRDGTRDAIALNSNGSRLAVGLPSGFSDSEVRVFDFDEATSTWTPMGGVIDTQPGEFSLGESLDMSPDGNHIAIGAPRFGGNGLAQSTMFDSGRVVVYTFQAGDWVQVGSEVVGAGGSQFGESVAISADGSRFIAGAPFADDVARDAGQAQVFELVNGDWAPVGDPIDGNQEIDRLGRAVDMSDDGLRVLARGLRSANDLRRAYVSVFDDTNGQWTQVGDDILGQQRIFQEFDDVFGFSLSMSGDGQRIAISAFNGGDERQGGQATVFELVGGNWQTLATFNGARPVDDLGRGISLNGDGSRIAVSDINFDIEIPGDFIASVGRVRAYALDETGPVCGGLPATLIGTDGDDQLIGTTGPDVIVGLQGNDIIRGLGGDDIVCAGQGDDTIFGGEGFDIIFGAQGNDTIFAANGANEEGRADTRGARMFGGTGNDTIFGSTRWDRMQGGPGNDELLGFEGRDWIRGGPQRDIINGGANIDDIGGGSGADEILVIGNDSVRAGAGEDLCIITSGAQPSPLFGCRNVN